MDNLLRIWENYEGDFLTISKTNIKMEHQEILDKSNNRTEINMAGFGPRWGAVLIDANILLIVIMLFFKSILPLLKSESFKASH